MRRNLTLSSAVGSGPLVFSGWSKVCRRLKRICSVRSFLKKCLTPGRIRYYTRDSGAWEEASCSPQPQASTLLSHISRIVTLKPARGGLALPWHLCGLLFVPSQTLAFGASQTSRSSVLFVSLYMNRSDIN